MEFLFMKILLVSMSILRGIWLFLWEKIRAFGFVKRLKPGSDLVFDVNQTRLITHLKTYVKEWNLKMIRNSQMIFASKQRYSSDLYMFYMVLKYSPLPFFVCFTIVQWPIVFHRFCSLRKPSNAAKAACFGWRTSIKPTLPSKAAERTTACGSWVLPRTSWFGGVLKEGYTP